MLVGDVGPEASLATAFFAARQHGHGRVVGPQHGRLQHQLFLSLVERLEQFGRRLDPVAQRTAGNVQAVAREEVFLPVQRQVIAELSDDDLSDQSWSGDAASNWPHRRRWAHHASFAVPAGVLGSHVDVHFELRRDVFQNSALVLANAVFRSAADDALLVRLAQVMLVAKVGQLIEVEFSATPTSCCYWARQFLSWLERRGRCAGGFEVEQMLLTFSLNDLLRAPAVDPPLEGAQFLERGLMCRLQLAVRGGCLIQHTAQFGRLLECRQQELVALGKISGKSVVVIHNDNCSSDSFRLEKSVSGIIFERVGDTAADVGARCADRVRLATWTAVDK
jgi:hypothetical protein